MKSSIFKEVINEEYIEVNRSVADTIRCLCEQSGGCHSETPDGLKLYFDCTKKGKMYVTSGAGGKSIRSTYQLYYVYGNVISKDNKTYVKITSVYSRSDIWLRMIFTALAIPLFILAVYIKGVYNIYAFLASAAVFVIGTADLCRSTYIRKKQKTEIVALMENEIKRRVKNIEKWDE
ncbi:MAG: hypothetical protein J5662_00730 [Clostridia bacterium]|nr:hypothetical protein [Clostridia bacterium]